MELDPDYYRLLNIFHPFALAKNTEMRNSGRRFVHYCSAEAAISILDRRKMWMRRSAVMNDFQEVEHGMQCLMAAWRSPAGERFKTLLADNFPGLLDEFVPLFDGWSPTFKTDSYLASLSEHDDDEDDLGRLSMWRAYGGTTGVAVVLNPSVFLNPSDALKAYTSPVAYLSPPAFIGEFDKLTAGMEAELPFLQAQGKDKVRNWLFQAFRYAAMCTKHPGFHEEREWRIVYQPSLGQSSRIEQSVKIVRGLPQIVCEIPLNDVPDEGLIGADPAGLINRVIIGPTAHPGIMREAFIFALLKAGVPDAEKKVAVSSIPLRQ